MQDDLSVSNLSVSKPRVTKQVCSSAPSLLVCSKSARLLQVCSSAPSLLVCNRAYKIVTTGCHFCSSRFATAPLAISRGNKDSCIRCCRRSRQQPQPCATPHQSLSGQQFHSAQLTTSSCAQCPPDAVRTFATRHIRAPDIDGWCIDIPCINTV
jgi:hypothetical protein